MSVASLHERFRIAGEPRLDSAGPGHGDAGFFAFGPDALGFGRLSGLSPASRADAPLPDALSRVELSPDGCRLPFDLDEVVEALRRERHAGSAGETQVAAGRRSLLRTLYYAVRPLLPVDVRKHLQRVFLSGWRRIPFPAWPVDASVDLILERALELAIKASGEGSVPFIWFWPEGRSGCLTLTHDVETADGLAACPDMMNRDAARGFRASYQLVPEKYPVEFGHLDAFRQGGCEINVHGLSHDGLLFRDRATFRERVGAMRGYAERWGARGFRSPVLYRNLEWFDELPFDYDMSVPNTARLDPQRGGCCTVFPYFVGNVLEIPLTTTQDYSLIHVLGRGDAGLWRDQTERILARHGLISVNTHPDYLADKAGRAIYAELLDLLAHLRDERNLWAALPGEIEAWWRRRAAMRPVRRDGEWAIEGPRDERARVALARSGTHGLEFEIV